MIPNLFLIFVFWVVVVLTYWHPIMDIPMNLHAKKPSIVCTHLTQASMDHLDLQTNSTTALGTITT